MSDQYEVKPVQDSETGLWDALDASGYGHYLAYATEAEVEAWISGYDAGAQENM